MNRISIIVALILLSSQVALGQIPKEADEDAVSRRFEWFYGTRGLLAPGADLEQARLARHRAATAIIAASRRASMTLAPWTSIGPAPINLSILFGPQAGRTTDLTFDPTDPKILYLSTSTGGMWRSNDGGGSWSCLTTALPSQSIGTTAVNPANAQEIWVGTGDYNGSYNLGSFVPYFGSGLFHSTDGGASWVASNGSGTATLPLGAIGAISIDPRAAGTLLVAGNRIRSGNGAVSGGIFLTTDGGATFSQVYGRSAYDLARDPGNPDIIYAGTRGGPAMGVAKSTDGGKTFVESALGINAQNARSRLAMAPSDPQVVYLLVGLELYRSNDGASSFSLVNSAACQSQCSYNKALAVSLDDPMKVYIGDTVPWVSTDGGQTLTQLSIYGLKIHPDVQHIEVHPTNPLTAYFGTDGGLWVTNNGGLTFNNLNANLNITQFYDIATHPTTDSIVIGGSQDTGNAHYAGNTLWEPVFAPGDGMMAAINPKTPDTCYVATQPSPNPSIWRSTTGPGGTYLPISGDITDTSTGWVTPYALDPQNPSTIYAGTERIWRSTDGGTSWSPISQIFQSKVIRSIAFAPSNSSVVYVGSGKRIYQTVNAGATWADVTGNMPQDGLVVDIAVHPTDPNRVYLVKPIFTGPTLYVSRTGGTTWSGIAAGLPQVPAAAVAFVKNPARLYIGTDVGVYAGPADAGPFIADMNGLPVGVPITELEFNGSTTTITAGTYGRGAWQKPADLAILYDLLVGKGAAVANDARVNAYRVDGSRIGAVDFAAFPSGGYGVNLAAGDLTGDLVGEILTGQGPGPANPPVGNLFSDAAAALGTFAAYAGSGFGLNLAAGGIDADAAEKILTGPGEGAVYGPHLRAFRYASGAVTPMGKVSFFAYGTLKFGVNPSAGDTDSDHFDEIVTGAGPGAVFGPHIRAFNFDGSAVAPIAKVSFFAYRTLRYGVNVTSADLDSDQFDEIVTGAGPGAVFGAQVRGFNIDAGNPRAMGKVNFLAYPASRYGVNVTAADLDQDGFSEMATGPGPDPTASARLAGFDYDNAVIAAIPAMSLDAYPGSLYGLTVGSGPLGY